MTTHTCFVYKLAKPFQRRRRWLGLSSVGTNGRALAYILSSARPQSWFYSKALMPHYINSISICTWTHLALYRLSLRTPYNTYPLLTHTRMLVFGRGPMGRFARTCRYCEQSATIVRQSIGQHGYKKCNQTYCGRVPRLPFGEHGIATWPQLTKLEMQRYSRAIVNVYRSIDGSRAYGDFTSQGS